MLVCVAYSVLQKRASSENGFVNYGWSNPERDLALPLPSEADDVKLLRKALADVLARGAVPLRSDAPL